MGLMPVHRLTGGGGDFLLLVKCLYIKGPCYLGIPWVVKSESRSLYDIRVKPIAWYKQSECHVLTCI